MTRNDRLQEMLSAAEGQKQFLDWISSDMTQLLLAVGREMARPLSRDGADAILKVQELGESIGANNIIDFMENPKRSGTQVSAQKSAIGLLPDYGAQAILKEAGYGEGK